MCVVIVRSGLHHPYEGQGREAEHSGGARDDPLEAQGRR